MGLDVEERLSVAHVHFLALPEIIHGQIVKVLFGDQDFAARKVCFEEGRHILAATLLGAVVVCYVVRL